MSIQYDTTYFIQLYIYIVITNTLFKHKKARRVTWTSPDGGTANQIDYINKSGKAELKTAVHINQQILDQTTHWF